MTNDIGRQPQAIPMLAPNASQRPDEPAVASRTNPMAGHALQTCRSLMEANRVAFDMIWNTAQRQQKFAFAVARTALAAFPGTNAPAKDIWSQAAAAYGEACGHGLEAMRAFADAALEAPLRLTNVAAGRPEAGAER